MNYDELTVDGEYLAAVASQIMTSTSTDLFDDSLIQSNMKAVRLLLRQELTKVLLPYADKMGGVDQLLAFIADLADEGDEFHDDLQFILSYAFVHVYAFAERRSDDDRLATDAEVALSRMREAISLFASMHRRTLDVTSTDASLVKTPAYSVRKEVEWW